LAAITFKKVDLNRFAKAYPFIRREPKYDYRASEPIALESAVVSFSGNDEVTYNFINPYSSAPVVIATPQDDSFNVYVKLVSTASVTIGSSVATSGSVAIVVVSE
jgi:hypothetical protein